MTTKKTSKSAKKRRPQDTFAAVASRLECDPDLKAFDAKLGKIAKAKPAGKWSEPRPVKRGEGFVSIFEPTGYGKTVESPTFATEAQLGSWLRKQQP